MISNMHRSHQMRSELYFHKMMNQADRFAKFKDPLNRYYLISAFVNLVILHAEAGNIPFTPRSFEQVMGEINDLIGEQFHPKLVNFINTEPQLYAKLKAVVRDGRYDKYYMLYKRYMSDKKPVKTTTKK